MEQIIFVCTGNTCRSPMCAGFFRMRGGEKRLGLKAASAGLFTTDGLPASKNAVIAAGELGADISAHLSRQLTAEMLDETKFLVCMTGAHYDRLVEQYPQYEDKIFTLTRTDIGDPFGGDLTVYRHAAQQIDDAVARLIDNMEQQQA